MKKRIGIVGEGPTDYLVLKCMIDQITGEENDYLRIQPEQNMLGEYGNGWKGVLYQQLIPTLESHWKQVIDLCDSAKYFEKAVKVAWGE